MQRLEAFLAVENPEVAQIAIDRLLQELPFLCEFPALGRPVHTLPEGFREFLVRFGKGAFVVRYRTTPTRIVLLAIRHSREAGS